jgi:hypothetical protein
MAELGGSAVEVAGRLNLDVAEGGELVERSIKVLGQQCADAIELQADGLGERGRRQTSGGDAGCCCSRG